MLLEGKRGVVFGVANRRSIAAAIAQSLAREGAAMAFNYLNDKLKRRVEEVVEGLDAETPLLLPCDVTDDDQIDAFFEKVADEFGTIDFLVHSVAFAQREDLEGNFVDTSREGFKIATEISSYSLPALARRAVPLMSDGGSIVTMTYLGGERVVPRYNVMGVAKAALESSLRYLAYDLGDKNIRVNGISAGPINTLSARGIKGFTEMLDTVGDRSPLRRNVTVEEVGDTALFLVSDMSSGITGEILFVDAGYHAMGM